MTRQEIEQEILKLIHQSLLHGSTRSVSLDEPIGALGIGLDSLGIMEFVAAVEQTFNVAVPDAMWVDQGQWTPGDFARLVLESSSPPAAGDRSPINRVAGNIPLNLSDAHKTLALFRQHGPANGFRLFLAKVRERLARAVYARETMIILSRDLTRTMPSFAPPGQNLSIRFASGGDSGAIAGLWPPSALERKSREYLHRFEKGYRCITAWEKEELVGADWLSGSGDVSEETGLMIRTRPGTCYAMELMEKYAGRGIGLALLAASLRETQALGYQRQVTYVRSTNHRMLAATVQMLGFERIGTIAITRCCTIPYPRWELNSAWSKERTLTV